MLHVIESGYLQQLVSDLTTTRAFIKKKHFHGLLLSIMATEDDYVEVPICYKKLQNLQPQLPALIIDTGAPNVNLRKISVRKTI